MGKITKTVTFKTFLSGPFTLYYYYLQEFYSQLNLHDFQLSFIKTTKSELYIPHAQHQLMVEFV